MAKIVNATIARARPYARYGFAAVPRVTFPVRKPAIKNPIQRAPKAHPQIRASKSSSSAEISDAMKRLRFRTNRPERRIGMRIKIIAKLNAAKKP